MTPRLEAYCRCIDVGGMEARGGVEAWSFGALEVRCRGCLKRGMEVWKRAAGGGLEMCRRRADVEALE